MHSSRAGTEVWCTVHALGQKSGAQCTRWDRSLVHSARAVARIGHALGQKSGAQCTRWDRSLVHSARAETDVWCTVHVITDTNFQHFSAPFNTRLPLLSYVTGFLTAQSDKPSFIYRLQAAMLCSAHQQHACAAFTLLFAFQVNAGSGGRWEGGKEGRG